MYLTERKLFFSAQSCFLRLNRSPRSGRFPLVRILYTGIRTRNGQMQPEAMRVPRGWRRGWVRLRLPWSDSHTIAGVGHTYRKCRARERLRSFSPGCEPATADSRRARELPQTHGRRVQHRTSLFWDKPWTLALSPLALLVPALYCGPLDERNSLLPHNGPRFSSAVKNASGSLGFGFELRGQLGKLRC